MADERTDMAERTEPATPKKKEDARRKGQVAQSRELQSVAILWVAAGLAGPMLGGALVLKVAAVAEASWSRAGSGLDGFGDFQAALYNSVGHAAIGVLPLMVLLGLAGGGSALAQTGPLFSIEAIAPKASRLSLVSGFKRFFDPDRLFDLGKSLFKVAVVGTITWFVITTAIELITGLLHVSVAESLVVAGRLARQVAFASLAFLTVMAAIDLVYQRWRHAKRLRMTRKEVRDEVKEREGSPHVRSRMRAMQQEMSRTRMIEAVADASVVVTNPTHYAVALQYKRELDAPKVLAKGRNHVARRIREEARRHDVPIVENPPLARVLWKTGRVGEMIPESLFQAVAEVLAFVYRVDARRGREWEATQ